MFLKSRNIARFGQLEFTSDCHCHLLPGVDDGAKNIEEAVEALHWMAEMGIDSAVLTPHINSEIFPLNSETFLRERFRDFLETLSDDIRASMELSLGAEYMVAGGFEERDMSDLLQFKPGKVLIEMSYLYESDNMEQALFALNMAGLKPVIAHPERYLYLSGALKRFDRYHDMGAEFQMNLLSLGGAYGKESLKILKYLLKKGWYTHLGTDAHSPDTLKAIASMEFDRSFLESL